MPVHCGDQRHLGLCLGYVPALAYGSCRVSDQGTTLRASDLHNARATILNPFSNDKDSAIMQYRQTGYFNFPEFQYSIVSILRTYALNNMSYALNNICIYMILAFVCENAVFKVMNILRI